MIPKNTSKIMKFLLRNIERVGCNINQMAKALNISVGSAFKILKELEKNKIVIPQNIGNSLYYRLDLNNEETVKICELLLIEERRQLTGYAKLYGGSLQKFDKAELIILFGSVLSKKEFNDIDVLFVTGDVREVNKFCLGLSKTRTKPVVPLILKKNNLINELTKKNEALMSVVEKGVVLKGESSFIEVIKNATK